MTLTCKREVDSLSAHFFKVFHTHTLFVSTSIIFTMTTTDTITDNKRKRKEEEDVENQERGRNCDHCDVFIDEDNDSSYKINIQYIQSYIVCDVCYGHLTYYLWPCPNGISIYAKNEDTREIKQFENAMLASDFFDQITETINGDREDAFLKPWKIYIKPSEGEEIVLQVDSDFKENLGDKMDKLLDVLDVRGTVRYLQIPQFSENRIKKLDKLILGERARLFALQTPRKTESDLPTFDEIEKELQDRKKQLKKDTKLFHQIRSDAYVWIDEQECIEKFMKKRKN